MRKIERHALNVARYGHRLCARQREVRDVDGFVLAFIDELARNRYHRVGIRTDHAPGHEPRLDLGKLPFFHALSSVEDGLAAWNAANDKGLTVLVCESVPPRHTRANFAVMRFDDEHVIFELDHGGHSERDMGHDAKLCRFAVGPSSYIVPFNHGSVKPLRCYDPIDVWKWRLDEIYRAVLTHGEDDLRGTLTDDGRLLLW